MGYNPWVNNTIITVVLLVLAAVAFLVEIILPQTQSS